MTALPQDTIYALATPPGVGALAVIRLSGPAVMGALTTLTHDRLLPPRVATLASLYGANGIVLDQAVVTFYQGPRSFTGEDCAELSLHGGRAVVDGVLNALATLPQLRLATPGEFTKRAFLNGKLDLTEAEAVADLIHAETALQRDQALAQLGGSLKDLYEGWRKTLVHACAYLEAHLDFPDEDLPTDLIEKIRPGLAQLSNDLSAHLDDGGRGERVRDGVRVVILGAPNVGKSSFLNAVARRDVAIVSEHAGTTRDVIDVHLDLNGAPVILTDTAGLRAVVDETPQALIEAEGMKRALDRAQRADLKLVFIDGTRGDHDISDIQDHITPHDTIVLFTKADQVPRETHFPPVVCGAPAYRVSSKTGDGLDSVMKILSMRVHGVLGDVSAAVLTRARHRDHLTVCLKSITHVLTSVLPPELMAEELRSATVALGRMTGRVDVEDLLDVIFRDFCIGK
jgi:tRNA modification GTPase